MLYWIQYSAYYNCGTRHTNKPYASSAKRAGLLALGKTRKLI